MPTSSNSTDSLYWHPTEHSMSRRNKNNNYHAGCKAYMVTLKIESGAKLLSTISPSQSTAPSSSPYTAPQASLCSATCCGIEPRGIEPRYGIELLPLGVAMRTAWLTLPERFHNTSVIDSPEEYVIMPEHFHGIIYVTGNMEEHLSDIISLFKARVMMSYRKLITQYVDGMYSTAASTYPAGAWLGVDSYPASSFPGVDSYPAGAFRVVGTSVGWMEGYKTLSTHSREKMRAWIDRQLAILYSATCCGTQKDPPPFKLSISGKRTKQGFLFMPGFTDSILLSPDDLVRERVYILNNPKSRLQRSGNRALLMPNRNNIDTAVTIPALFGYLRRECTLRDVTPEKLASVQALLMCSATCCGIERGTAANGAMQGGTAAKGAAMQGGTAAKGAAMQGCTAKGTIQCWSYGDRSLLERRLLPLVCHRRDAWQLERQRARCLEEAQKGAVIVSAGISNDERGIFKELLDKGYPVVHIEDNGFPEIYHPSQERIDLCGTGQLLIVTPWQYHYRHKDEAIYVAYCKTMNCVAQALCRLKDSWWKG